MKSAIVIGASSGIGRALAVALSLEGYRVGVVARRTDLLAQLQAELTGPLRDQDCRCPARSWPCHCCGNSSTNCRDVELFIVNAGVGFENAALAWEAERDTIAVNVLGFAGMVNVAVAHLEARGSGHLVGISSVAALRGLGGAPAYAASKAFVSNYLQGVRYRFNKLKLPVIVTDVQPGFVDTAMAAGNRFWIASPQTAARQIVAAIHGRKNHVYVTRRWRLIAWLLKVVPDALYSKF
jgi:short-subunit dehydrogenase